MLLMGRWLQNNDCCHTHSSSLASSGLSSLQMEGVEVDEKNCCRDLFFFLKTCVRLPVPCTTRLLAPVQDKGWLQIGSKNSELGPRYGTSFPARRIPKAAPRMTRRQIVSILPCTKTPGNQFQIDSSYGEYSRARFIIDTNYDMLHSPIVEGLRGKPLDRHWGVGLFCIRPPTLLENL